MTLRSLLLFLGWTGKIIDISHNPFCLLKCKCHRQSTAVNQLLSLPWGTTDEDRFEQPWWRQGEVTITRQYNFKGFFVSPCAPKKLQTMLKKNYVENNDIA